MASGTYGDVQPFISLAYTLKNAGYEIVLATHKKFEKEISGLGLDFHAISGDPAEVLQSDVGKEWIEALSTPYRIIRVWKKLQNLFKSVMEDALKDCWTASRGADAIIHSFLPLAGHSIAEKLGVPCISVYVVPLTRTRTIPNLFTPLDLSFGRSYNYFSHVITENLTWLAYGPYINKWRKCTLGVKPLPYRYDNLTNLVLYPFSPSAYPRPFDWGDNVKVTGYWKMPVKSDWNPPESLLDFLNNGSKPVFIGFGSMAEDNPEETQSIIFKALDLTGKRGVVVKGWSDYSSAGTPKNVYILDQAPYDWLFEKMEAAIHHGGMGTTGFSLMSGIPTAVVHTLPDQIFWGRQLAALGVGPEPVPRKKLDYIKLAGLINRITSDPDMKEQAMLLKAKIAIEEDPLEKAVRLIENYIT